MAPASDRIGRTLPAVELLLNRLVRATLVLGKGGVGKTTCATAIAARLAARGEETVLVSTDPAGSLSPTLGVELVAARLTPVGPVPRLWALQLDPAAARSTFLERWRDVLVTIVDRGTYLDTDDIAGLVDAAFPGADEIFGLLVLAELLAKDTRNGDGPVHIDRLVIDTAPTGHTLRLLALPETFDAMIALLESMQSKHRFMVQALTHRYRPDAADAFLDEMRRMIGGLRTSLRDGTLTRAVLVARPEPVVLDETRRYAEALRTLRIAIAAVVLEAVRRQENTEEAELALRAAAEDAALFSVPVVDPPPADWREMTESLGHIAESHLRRSRAKAPSRRRGKTHPHQAPSTTALASALPHLLKTITIVGGKGGVGKTTVACAIALTASFDDSIDGDILLVSTDPAPSIGDALGVAAPRWAYDAPEPVPGVPRLLAWQMDASAAFQSLRERYQDRIDALFDGFMGRTVDLSHDRAIVRDLLALAPPGIDEIYALASLGDALAEKRYARIIVDPAPTGHLLRLLELPPLAIDWSHRLMRLIMKYKDIAGLSDAAADLVNFSRHTRALDTLLRDPTRAGAVLVALDEPPVIAETARLAAALQRSGIPVLGAVWNRVSTAGRRDRGALTEITLEAPLAPKPLLGSDAIGEWSGHWMVRHPDQPR